MKNICIHEVENPEFFVGREDINAGLQEWNEMLFEQNKNETQEVIEDIRVLPSKDYQADVVSYNQDLQVNAYDKFSCIWQLFQ